MTVADLIAKLQALPQDRAVLLVTEQHAPALVCSVSEHKPEEVRADVHLGRTVVVLAVEHWWAAEMV